MLPDLSSEERRSVQPVARAMALDFLQERLAEVQAKIEQRQAYLAETYPEGEPLPRGEAEVLQTYRQEQALIRELIEECQEKLLPEVLRQRLKQAQRRTSALEGRPKSSPAARAQRWQAETEQQILRDLLQQWTTWLKGA